LYRIIMNLQEYTHNISGTICLILGYLLACVLFVLVIGPMHNAIKGRAAWSNGDEWVAENGYLSMNPKMSFHWIGLLSVVVTRLGFTKRVRYRQRYFDAPVLGTIWLSLSGILTYLLCSAILVFFCALMGRVNSFDITTPTIVPQEQLPFFGCVFHTSFAMVFYASRMCIYSALFNLIPIAPMDMGEILFLLIGKHWSDVIKKNDLFISVGLFLLAFFVLGMPDSFVVTFSTDIITMMSSAFNFIINIFL